MAIKSNVLTHFTNSIDNLENILTNNFIPKLCLEDYEYLLNKEYKMFIPMVCFCDIPLHLIHTHINDYGSYGLGLSKKWGIKNKLNPVIYLEKESILSESIGEILDNLPENTNTNILTNFWKIFCLLKPYQGINKLLKNKVFYEENEWRYIPQKMHVIEGDSIFGLTLLKEEAKEESLNKINTILSKQPLIFEPEDIQYIFIDNERERKSIIELIKNIKSIKYSSDTINTLCSKIISYEQIEGDV